MKGMTNALPVLIDASTLATKSDISDMETKTNANATFATKTALTTLQNATKAAVSEFAITETADKVTITTTAIDGATSKSEDIPAVTDTMAGIVTPALKKKWDSSGTTTKKVYTGNLIDLFEKVEDGNSSYYVLKYDLNIFALYVSSSRQGDDPSWYGYCHTFVIPAGIQSDPENFYNENSYFFEHLIDNTNTFSFTMGFSPSFAFDVKYNSTYLERKTVETKTESGFYIMI